MAKLQRIGSLSRQGSLATRQHDNNVFTPENDEEAVMWVSVEKLPPYARMRTGILTLKECEQREVDVKRLGFIEKKALLGRLVKTAEEDHKRFLMKLRDHIDIGAGKLC